MGHGARFGGCRKANIMHFVVENRPHSPSNQPANEPTDQAANKEDKALMRMQRCIFDCEIYGYVGSLAGRRRRFAKWWATTTVLVNTTQRRGHSIFGALLRIWFWNKYVLLVWIVCRRMINYYASRHFDVNVTFGAEGSSRRIQQDKDLWPYLVTLLWPSKYIL